MGKDCKCQCGSVGDEYILHAARNKAAVISGMLEAIFGKDFEIKENKKEFIKTLIKEGKSLNKILNNGLMLLKSMKNINLQLCDINYFLGQKVFEFDEVHSAAFFEFDEGLNDEAIVLLDEHLFSICITDIVRNAIEANAKNIKIASDVKDSKVFINIINDGDVINNIAMEKIFNPFFTTKNNGMGIGLATVKKIIVDGHGGEIFVSSNVEEGTNFVISLPLIKT